MTGLIIEGGARRGIFTAGITDCLLENKIHFDVCRNLCLQRCRCWGNSQTEQCAQTGCRKYGARRLPVLGQTGRTAD